MASPIVGIRIPTDLLKQIDDRATEGRTRTDIIIELLRLGLAQPEPEPEHDRLTVLDERLTVLEGVVRQALDSRLTEGEASVKRLSNDRRTERKTNVKQALDSHSTEGEAVRSIVEQRQSTTGKVALKDYGVLPPNAAEGLSQTALCDFYGLSWRNLKRNAAAAGFDSLEAYLEQMTGITWTQEKKSGTAKLYFPKD
ncbi:MAG: ribbon-helix-helix domain-containing protein [Myxacorys californica WJT36-NPBG1]|nr:ribbon-helix-helix domain-containing protein [Myxacorys californica WJT36-NPBG1]